MIGRRLLSPKVVAPQIAVVLVAALGLALALDTSRATTEPRPAAAAPGPAIDRRASGVQAVEEAQRRLEGAPDDLRAVTRLAGAYLLRVRETGDPTYYAKADLLAQRVLDTQPDDVDTLTVAGGLAAARHDFPRALALGQKVTELAPQRSAGYGVVVDALVELGRYDEAVVAAQHMIDLRPDQTSYTRVSYLRELHGDLDGAVQAMQQAIQAGAPDSEATAWSEYQVGNLLFALGNLPGAEQAYRSSTLRVDDYVYGIAGLGRVRAARGDLSGAAVLYEQAVHTMPLPEFAATLGDLYTRLGQTERAQEQYELVGAMERLLAANGVRVDIDLALFDADHGRDLATDLDAARAEYAIRPSVHVADTLAWIEYQQGDLAAAAAHSREALRLGSRDPLMLYRAGIIAQAAGDLARGHDLLSKSSQLNSEFSVRWAPDLAERMAASMGGQG